MNILVPVKRVLDPYARIRVTPDGQIDDSEGLFVINPFDEIAIEQAVRLREEAAAPVEIVAVSVGAAECDEQLRHSLAAGADSAILIETVDDGERSPVVVAALLASLVRREAPDLILMGKQATDDDSNQTGQRLAALLGWPQATFASRIDISPDGAEATVTREVDRGRETIAVSLPAVVTVDLRLCEPRYVALPAIVRARSKPLQRIPAAELGEVPAERLRTLRVSAPPPRAAGRTVASVDDLLAALEERGASLTPEGSHA